MQDDYYWLEVTSCLFVVPPPTPHEAHHCRTCEGCCVELSPGNMPLRRNEGLFGKDTHTEERDALQIRKGLHVLRAKNSTRIHNSRSCVSHGDTLQLLEAIICYCYFAGFFSLYVICVAESDRRDEGRGGIWV